ncbi:MAG: MFS transporter [Spirochaetaceae bacterium]|nr:MFS transporter [Spirochaetaceae bacterium]
MSNVSNARKFGFFGSIYFVEGAVLTMFSTYMIIYLRKYSLSFTQIGLISSISLLPTILKIFIGAVSDKWSLFGRGHRKPYILLGLILQGLGYVVLPLISPVESYGLFVAVSFCIGLGMATYDTTTDGLGIDTTPDADRGNVQAFCVGGRALSAVVFGVAFGLLAGKDLWRYAFWLIAALSFLEALALPLVRERPAEPGREFALVAFKELAKPAYLVFVLIGTLFPLALYSSYSMLSVFLKEGFGVGMNTIALLSGLFGIGQVAGGLAGGPLLKRLGRKAGLYTTAVVTALATLFIGVMPSGALAWLVVPLFGAAFGYYSTIYFAVAMDFADPRIAAFMFAVTMAFGNLGISGGSALSGILVDKVGFRPLFLIYAGVNLLMIVLSFVVFRLRKDLAGKSAD